MLAPNKAHWPFSYLGSSLASDYYYFHFVENLRDLPELVSQNLENWLKSKAYAFNPCTIAYSRSEITWLGPTESSELILC